MVAQNGSSKAPRRRGRKGKEIETTRNGYSRVAHQADSADVLSYKPHKTLLIHLTEATPTWYECGRGSASRDDTLLSVKKGNDKKPRTNSNATVAKYRKLADSIYQQEVVLSRANSATKDEAWVENTMKRGTLKDRIAAMSVVVSTSPVHKLYALDMLLNLAGISTLESGNSSQTNERVSAMAAEALTDLFSNTLLPTHRKLVGLESRPLYQYEESQNNTAKRTISPRILLLWRYEEIIKNKYSAFLSQYLGKTLSQTSTSVESLTKINALRTACSLLKEIPEGEQLLLNLVANKVGDPTKKIASAAAHELRKILEVHPNMTTVIAREVQQLAHRPNLSTRALYNCIIFLNQLKLVKEEPPKKEEENGKKGNKKSSLPASLINTYFQIFEVAVSKTVHGKKQKSNAELDQAMKSRLLGALLTGVNRAHPYLPSNDKGMEQHVDSLFRIAHVAPPSACTQALMLLFHLAVSNNNEKSEPSDSETDANTQKARKDRFYRALYSKMADPTMLFGRQLTLYFNLIFKSMKYDDNKVRIVAFGKRLLHTSFHYNPAVTSGALFLISEVMKNHPGLSSSAFSSDGNAMKFDPLKREPSAAFSLAIHPENGDDEEGKKEADDHETSEEGGSLWELSLSLHHYHPTVCKFTSDVGSIEYNGDPLKDFTLAPFLDKFAFRNPKSLQKIKNKFRRGQSVGERRSGIEVGVNAAKSLPVNDPDFWKKQKNPSEQDDFFQKFFAERAKRDELKGVVRGKKGEEVDALDAAEIKEVDLDWDSDDSEERFAQSLAEGLMKSSGEKIEYDEEDPDMDDWSDYGGSDDDGDGDEKIEISDAGDIDEMLDGDSDDEPGEKVEVDIAHVNDDSDSDGEDEELLGLTFTDDLEDNSVDQDETSPENGGKRNVIPESSFADLSEYEERINEAWDRDNRKRMASTDDMSDDELIEEPKKSKKKRKRGKKKKKV